MPRSVNKLVSLLVGFIFFATSSFPVYAEYYLVYSSNEPKVVCRDCCAATKCVVKHHYKKPVKKTTKHTVKKKYKKVHHTKPRSSYSISVYYTSRIYAVNSCGGDIWIPEHYTCYGEWMPGHWESPSCNRPVVNCNRCANKVREVSYDTVTRDDVEYPPF